MSTGHPDVGSDTVKVSVVGPMAESTLESAQEETSSPASSLAADEVIIEDGHVCTCEPEFNWDEKGERLVSVAVLVLCSHCRGEHGDCVLDVDEDAEDTDDENYENDESDENDENDENDEVREGEELTILKSDH